MVVATACSELLQNPAYEQLSVWRHHLLVTTTAPAEQPGEWFFARRRDYVHPPFCSRYQPAIASVPHTPPPHHAAAEEKIV